MIFIFLFVAAGIGFSLSQEEPSTVTASLGAQFSGIGTLILAILTVLKRPDVPQQLKLKEGSKLKYEAKRRSTKFVELTNIAFSRTLVSNEEDEPNRNYYDFVMIRINEKKSILNDFTEIWIDVEIFFEGEKITPPFKRFLKFIKMKRALGKLKKGLYKL